MTAGVGIGEGVGAGVAGAVVGAGVTAAGAAGGAGWGTTVDSAWTDDVDVSGFRFGRAFSAAGRRFGVAVESEADGGAAADICGLTAISPVGAV